MKAEILSIGTELLVGSILNTNARHLSQRLAEASVDVYRQTTVGDNIGRIAEAFISASKNADLVISSGGLGPTADDVTAEAFARVVRKPLLIHKPTLAYIKGRMERRGLVMNDLVARQCRLPKGAVIFKNDNGTAPGILCQTRIGGRRKWFLALPGPPREMEPLFKKILPFILRKTRTKKSAFVIRSVKIQGLIESQVAEKVEELLEMKPPVTVGIYARAGEVELKIMSKAVTKSSAVKRADDIEALIRSRFGEKVFGVDGETLQSSVLGLLKSKKKTLAAAESCTGGLFSSLITDIDGSSGAFKGSIVAYQNGVKKTLGLSRILKKNDVVSTEIASALAGGARKFFKSDYAVGITGLLGDPVKKYSRKARGTVCIAVAGPSGVSSFETVFLEKKRAEIKLRAVTKALDMLRLALLAR
jgi:nicotinamide-nucleotide amidase